MGGGCALHGGGEPALTMVDVAIPEDGFGDGRWGGNGERKIAAGVEGGGGGVLGGDEGARVERSLYGCWVGRFLRGEPSEVLLKCGDICVDGGEAVIPTAPAEGG